MIIAVMGLTGSGKSTVARVLASKLSCQLFDMDKEFPEEYVRRRHDHEIVPAEDVKEYQREMLERMLGLEAAGDVVMAGFFLDDELPKLLDRRAHVVWINLVTDDKELLRWRVTHRGAHFPEAEQILEENWVRREDQLIGDLKVDCGLPLLQVVNQCLALVAGNGNTR